METIVDTEDRERFVRRLDEIGVRTARGIACRTIEEARAAAGYPLACVAAKIAIGYTLPDIPNAITRRTTSFFEPALDYLVYKFPRWDISKFGVEMASTGEVGCFGDDLHEALLHALQATGFRFPRNRVLLSLGPVEDKFWFADEARAADLRHRGHGGGAGLDRHRMHGGVQGARPQPERDRADRRGRR